MNSKVGSLIAIVFGAVILATPWFFGGNIPPARTVLLALMFLCSAFCLLCPGLVGTPTRIGIVFKCLLIGSLAYIGLQLIPMGESTLSTDPAATRGRLCELLLGISTCFVASFVFRNQKLLPWFLGFVALNGVLITFFGLAQTVSSTDRLYWLYELTYGGQPFGPFVNSNNAGGYLLLCFAAANFFLAQRVFRSRHLKNSDQGFVPRNQSMSSALLNSVGSAFAKMETKQLYILAAVAIIAAGVLASISRGAAVALFISVFIGWGLLFRRSLAFGFASLLVAAAGIGVLAWTQQGEAVVSGLETLSDIENSSRNRIAHWQDAWQYTSDNQPLGSGLGTYSLMYPSYQTTWHFKRWFRHAENQYLEALAELGIPGLLFLLVAIGLVTFGSIKLLSSADSTSRAVGLTGLLAVVSQGVAGAFDFGLYIPANNILMAALVGVVFSQLNWTWAAQHVAEIKLSAGKARLSWAAMLIVTMLTGWAAYEYSAVDASNAVRRFTDKFEPHRDRELVADYQKWGEYAVRVRPDDSFAHYNLALNHILQYRLAASDMMVQQLQQQRQHLESAGIYRNQPVPRTIFGADQQSYVRATLDEPAWILPSADASTDGSYDGLELTAEEADNPPIVRLALPPIPSGIQPEIVRSNPPELRPENPPVAVADANLGLQFGQSNETTPLINEAQSNDPQNFAIEVSGERQKANPEFTSQNSLVESSTGMPLEAPALSAAPASSPVPAILAAAEVDRQSTPVIQLPRAIQPDTESALTAEQERRILLDMLPENFDFDQAWERSTLTALHRLAWASKREGGTHLQELRSSEPVTQSLTKAWKHLLLAEKHNSKYWLTPMRLAHLCLLMEQGEDEEKYLADSIARCPKNSDLMFMIGLSKHDAGQSEEAFALWKRCLEHSREHDETIIQICRNEVGIKAFFDQVLPSEPSFRIRIAKRYFGSDGDGLIRKLLMVHSKSKIGDHDLTDGEKQYAFAEMERISQNYEVSFVHFKKALELKNHRYDWRMQYARSLLSAEMYDEAIAELKVCELYNGKHLQICQRLIRQAKRLRMKQFKYGGRIQIGRN